MSSTISLPQSSYKGLDEQQVLQKQKESGFNELPSAKKNSLLHQLISVVKEPMLLLLLISGGIYFFLGEIKDALMLMSFVVVVIGITFYQERKTEKALLALRNLASPRALVIRNGQQIRIPGREVVVDDVMILQEGDRVPADAVVLSSTNLLVDESLLTGESISVRKAEWDGKLKKGNPGGDDLPFVYSGTLVTQGQAVVKVTEIGAETEMGKIGKALQTITEEDTLLKKETGRLIRLFATIGIALCVVVVLIYGLVKHNWLQGVLSGISLSMAMLPEEFSVVMLIFLSLGAWRMSKRKVLTRKTAMIETLGAVRALCVDKTGTITLNKMQLQKMVTGDEIFDLQSTQNGVLPEKFHSLIEFSMLASEVAPFDPLEKEIKRVTESYLKDTEHIHWDWQMVKEYSFSRKILTLSHVWQSKERKELVVAAKGAPEGIADLCHLDKMAKEKLQAQIDFLSSQGLRLIGVAKASFPIGKLPDDQHDFDFEFEGLLGFMDPVRPGIAEAVKECYQAGIRVIMITGDYPGTAMNIASQIGLNNVNKYITGMELQKMNHLELREKIRDVNIFARVVPEQKLAIVNALKANGEIVSMTGDGVNDAPALKSANIGIAMGERGTDVAREAAGLVLLNDDFSSIVAAVRMGRRIYDNLKKAIAYIFAVHIPIAGMTLLPVLFGFPPVLLPAHIAFLELIIDPACSVVFESEKEETGIMNHPPRNLKKPLFNRRSLIVSLIQGVSILVMVFLSFIVALKLGRSETEARTISFVAIVFANLMLIITNLSWHQNFIEILKSKNKALFWVLGGTISFLLLILALPFFRSLFHFSLLRPLDFVIALAAGVLSIFWFEGIKLLERKKVKQS